MPKGLYKDTAEDSLGAKVYLTSYRVMRHAETILSQEFDLTFHSYLTLYYIDRIPRISMRHLCEYLDVSQSIVSRTIGNLEQRKYVTRATASDRRKTELSLSSEARRKLRRASGRLNELSFVLRHQPDFRIAAIDDQLDRVLSSVEITKSRPLVRRKSSDVPSQSVIVRLGKKMGV
jgi:DNA-binding MarR family transcriptional regulator